MFQILIGLLVMYLFYELYWKRRSFPPGPMPLPFLGNSLAMLKHDPGYDAFINMSREFGPVYTYWLGNIPFVIIGDFQTMKDTFIKDGDSYTDRYRFSDFSELSRGGNYGVIETDGPFWREHRRFAIHQLRDMGLGKNLMEQRIFNEIEAMTTKLKEASEDGIEMRPIFNLAVGSVMNKLMFGYRFDADREHEFHHLRGLIDDQGKKLTKPMAGFVLLYPKLRKLPYFRGFMKSEVLDYVDAYLKEQKRREAEGDMETFSTTQLINMCLDMWKAGLETTSMTLNWGLNYILNHPEVQDKIHDEMSRVIGSSRLVAMADKNELVYMSAVVNEIQRLTNLLPLNLFHVTTRDVVIHGHQIKKGTGVIAQISSVLYNEKIFPEPYSFKPERFIDENGKLKKVEELVPFSLGKRQCMGEGLAKMELFLTFANLFNRFKVTAVGGPPSMKKSFKLQMNPEPYKCRMEERYQEKNVLLCFVHMFASFLGQDATDIQSASLYYSGAAMMRPIQLDTKKRSS